MTEVGRRDSRCGGFAEDASAIVEAAILIPIVLVMVLGTVQWGMIIAARITLRNATAIGARTATLDNSDTTKDATALQKTLDALEPMLDKKYVLAGFPKFDPNCDPTDKCVWIMYDLPLIVPVLGLRDSYRLESRTTMRGG